MKVFNQKLDILTYSSYFFYFSNFDDFFSCKLFYYLFNCNLKECKP